MLWASSIFVVKLINAFTKTYTYGQILKLFRESQIFDVKFMNILTKINTFVKGIEIGNGIVKF